MLLLYYTFISLLFVFGGSYLTGYSTNIDLNTTTLQSDEIDTGGAFTGGVSFVRYLVFIGFGIGLSPDTPSWFAIIYAGWSTLLTIFTMGFIISSIWNG